MSSAKDVRGFSMYPAYRPSLALLSDEDRGRLLLSLFDYYDGVDTSSALTPQARMAFAFISAHIEQERCDYLDRCRTNRENASRRWQTRDRESAPKEDG